MPSSPRSAEWPSPKAVFCASLTAYLLITTALSISQIGYLNADFVGYSTIAHRLVNDPPASVTGYWSSLYAWCMAPLIWAGMDDLAAGRVVLVAGGVLYIVAIFGVVCRFYSHDERRNRVLTVAVMTVAVVQAASWATRLLDPDLLADALLFCYFYAVLDPKLPHSPPRALAAGAVAGLAYLGKAYMLPFTLMHLPATLLMRLWSARRSGRTQENCKVDSRALVVPPGHRVPMVGGSCDRIPPKGGTTSALCSPPSGQTAAIGLRRLAIMAVAFSVGLAVVAGPWIAVLTSHYGKLTFSTAGPANHANMGPTAFGNDPLWNPGLVAGFIVDPHFGPDWSAWQDGEHFLQQLKVIAYNLNNCLAFVVPWVVFGGIFAAAGMRRKNSPLRAPCEAMVAGEGGHHVPMVGVRAGSIGLWWCVVTVVLFCGGYSLINLESRYIVPVITPLLCLGAMLVAVNPPGPAGSRLDGMRRRWRKSAWWVAPVILLVSALDLSRLASIPLSHPQSARLARYRPVVEQLRLSGIEGKTFAANRWHDGLYVSYAAGNVPNYLGTPLRNTATSLIDQLRQSKAAVYLRWHRLDDPAETDKMADAPPDPLEEFVPAAPWRLAATIPDSGPEPGVVEIWMRD